MNVLHKTYGIEFWCFTHQVRLGINLSQFKLFTNAKKQSLDIKMNSTYFVE